MYEPQSLTTLPATTACYRDSFSLYTTVKIMFLYRPVIHLSSVVHPQVAAGTNGLRLIVAAKRKNKQLKKANKGWFSSLVIAWRANSCLQYLRTLNNIFHYIIMHNRFNHTITATFSAKVQKRRMFVPGLSFPHTQ
jgi:hypothetical protein